jgi:hypothetical protein
MYGTESLKLVFLLPVAWRSTVLWRSAAYLNFIHRIFDTTVKTEDGVVSSITRRCFTTFWIYVATKQGWASHGPRVGCSPWKMSF